MIKINVNGNTNTFHSELEVTKFLFEQFNRDKKSFSFQKLTYSNGELEDMEYLTFDNGRVKETHNTKF
jgi:hypothetical protein